jgi:hypothetical protein
VSVFDAEVSKNFHGFEDRTEAEQFPLSGFIRKQQLHYDFDNQFISAILVAYRPCDPDMGGVDWAGYCVSPKLENIGGRDCLIVRPRMSQEWEKSYWVDPSRDFLVLRVVSARRGYPPSSTLDISYVEDEEHGWVPSGWKLVRTGGSPDRVFEQATVRISHYEINPDVPKAEFQFEFPPDTAVTDHRSGTRYIARENGARRVVTREELGRGATSRDLVATETGDAALEDTGGMSVRWYYLVPGAVIVLLVAVIVRRRLR